MRKYLVKRGQKNDDFLELEVDNNLLRQTTGKVGLRATKKTTHCGTYEKALKSAEDIIAAYKKEGFSEERKAEPTDPIIFDNAAWHYGGDFPSDLSDHQAYVHTGFYIGWLLQRRLFSLNFQTENKDDINQFMEQKITAPGFYKNFMDGKFMSDELTDTATRFTKDYFSTDFSKSLYIHDLIASLCNNLPSVYYVKDNWDNFKTMYAIIERRFKEWKQGNLS